MSRPPIPPKPPGKPKPHGPEDHFEGPPQPSVPETPIPETDPPHPPLPGPFEDAERAEEALALLQDYEKHLVTRVTQEVLARIDPLLIKLQQISNEAVSKGAQQKVQELERGINERIEHRIKKINALLGRSGG